MRELSSPALIAVKVLRISGQRRTAIFAAILLAVVIVIAVCAAAGLWFVPFVAGIGAGAVARDRRLRVVWPATVVTAVVGWAVPLAWMSWRGEPVGATAGAVGAFAGLAASAMLIVGITLLVAAVQASTGLWLARALFRRGIRLPPSADATDRAEVVLPIRHGSPVGAQVEARLVGNLAALHTPSTE